MKDILDLSLEDKYQIFIERKNIIYWEKHIQRNNFLYKLFLAFDILAFLWMLLLIIELLYDNINILLDVDRIYIILVLILLIVPMKILLWSQYLSALTSKRVYEKESIFTDYLSYSDYFSFKYRLNIEILLPYKLPKIYINNIEKAIEKAKQNHMKPL